MSRPPAPEIPNHFAYELFRSMTGAEMATYLKSEIDKCGRIVKAIGLQID